MMEESRGRGISMSSDPMCYNTISLCGQRACHGENVEDFFQDRVNRKGVGGRLMESEIDGRSSK